MQAALPEPNCNHTRKGPLFPPVKTVSAVTNRWYRNSAEYRMSACVILHSAPYGPGRITQIPGAYVVL